MVKRVIYQDVYDGKKKDDIYTDMPTYICIYLYMVINMRYVKNLAAKAPKIS
jgi:hypothetical protein